MADALKVKIMARVTNMRSEKKLQGVLRCVEKIIDTPGQSQLSLVKTPRPSSSSSAGAKRAHDDSKGPRVRGYYLKTPGHQLGGIDEKRPAPASWTQIELEGEKDPQFNYDARTMLYSKRSKPPSKNKKRKAF